LDAPLLQGVDRALSEADIPAHLDPAVQSPPVLDLAHRDPELVGDLLDGQQVLRWRWGRRGHEPLDLLLRGQVVLERLAATGMRVREVLFHESSIN